MNAKIKASALWPEDDTVEDPNELFDVGLEIAPHDLTCENCDSPIAAGQHILVFRDVASEMISHLHHYLSVNV